MKKIISILVALSMTISMTCTTTFAINDINISEQYSFEYTDKTLQLDNGIATLALDDYEPNNFDNPHSLGYIKAKSNPFIEINASVNNTDDIQDAYSVSVNKSMLDNYENVDELVVLLNGLSKGEQLIMVITTKEGKEVASGVIDGDLTSGVYVYFPTESDGYNIYIKHSENTNDEINYILQVASRYIRSSTQVYAHPTEIKFSSNSYWSLSGYFTIKDAPQSAIIDSIDTFGTLINTKTGNRTTAMVALKNGEHEIGGSCPITTINITRSEIPVNGEWTIKYTPYQYAYDPHTLYNYSLIFNYTYDILEG